VKYLIAMTITLLAVVAIAVSEAAILRYVVRCEARRFVRVVVGDAAEARRGGAA